MWYALICILFLLADQISKIAVATLSGATGPLAGGEVVHIFTVIDNFFYIEYCENSNGAMGLFSNIPNIQTIFKILTVVIIIAIVIYMIINKGKSKWLNLSLTLILSGAIGNFIDRLTTTYVRDMIHFVIKFNNKELFPYIFNIADVAVCVGGGMVIFYLLFIDKDAIFRSKKSKAKLQVKLAKINSNVQTIDKLDLSPYQK